METAACWNGRLWDAGDVCQLCALLPPNAAGALQDRRGRRLPAEVLPPHQWFNCEDVCTCPQVSVSQQFDSVPWNSFNCDMLKTLYDFTSISMHCNKSLAICFQNLSLLPG
ncbi:dopamine beta-hydroxylase-like isoform X2 [Macaca nemestrina]|uniref:dopamine beta-hydroxylase-like isoform X2 n=1 Tax=Macaca nemestrina TaxID=9545 RepID=UPI0039B87CAF